MVVQVRCVPALLFCLPAAGNESLLRCCQAGPLTLILHLSFMINWPSLVIFSLQYINDAQQQSSNSTEVQWILPIMPPMPAARYQPLHSLPPATHSNLPCMEVFSHMPGTVGTPLRSSWLAVQQMIQLQKSILPPEIPLGINYLRSDSLETEPESVIHWWHTLQEKPFNGEGKEADQRRGKKEQEFAWAWTFYLGKLPDRPLSC